MMHINPCRSWNGPVRLLVVLTALLLGACAGTSNEDIARVSKSGIAFSNQAPRVYDFAFEETVKRDNAELLKERERTRAVVGSTSPEQAQALKTALQTRFEQTQIAIQKRLEQFRVMKNHSATLGRYFVTLNALASGATSEAAENAANGIANQLGELVPGVKAVSIGGKNLSELAGPATGLIVASFTNSKLNAHLARYGTDVLEAIGLQKAMMALLVEIQVDRLQARLDTSVEQSFLNLDKDLPADWQQRRQQNFNVQLQPNPLTAGLQAATELESNFKQLAQGNQGALDSLERAIVLVGTIMDIYQASQQGASQ